MGTGPIAYWPLDELTGTTAHCLIDAAQDGTYSSDVSGWPPGTGIGDGSTAPYFDGTNDYINIQTVAFQAAIDGAEGTLMQWLKVSGAGDWTDGLRREAFRTVDTTDGNEVIWQAKDSVNNQWWFRRMGAGVIEDIRQASGAPTGWKCLALTWSEAADQVKAYVDGAQTGGTATILGAWAGSIDETWIGCASIGPVANAWKGWIAHTVIWDQPLSQPELATLAVV